jgi:outer membrane murein-binding lipoprotein Lpp
METRELYKNQAHTRINDLSAKFEELKAEGEKLSDKAKAEMKPHIDAIHEKIEAAKVGLTKLSYATEEKWDEIVKEADDLWNQVKSSLEHAAESLKSHTKANS